ncbi:cytochrome c [Pseudohoeflea suaedae]|uniref:Cytochrome c n=2 Tax=Pseudohoeflea suaedae TaxID=877384 RepID=A0A4R5PI29_9HYPH|nr:cytochrome c [Pseudohoeflea suaedae]
MRKGGWHVAAACSIVLTAGLAHAGDPLVEEGRELVELNCSNCHAVGVRDASPHDQAPPFRTLSRRYPLDALEEAFAAGHITSGHPDMPDFVARPDQVEAILAYIDTIQED